MNKYEANALHQKMRKTKQYGKHIVDEELSVEGLDKVNSFKPEINVHSVCVGHDHYFLNRNPHLSFTYRGKMSIEDVLNHISKIKDTKVEYVRIRNYPTMRLMHIFHINFTYKKENFLDEVYESFKELKSIN